MKYLFLTLCLTHFLATARPLETTPKDCPENALGEARDYRLLHQSLNQYVRFINEAVYATRWLQQSLVSYNLHANYYLGADFSQTAYNGNITYSPQRFSLPYASFDLAKKESKYIPDSYRIQVQQSAGDLFALMYQMDSLSGDLAKYIAQKAYKSDNLSRSDQILSQFEALFNEFDLQKERVFQLLQEIHIRHDEPAGKDPVWEQLFGALDAVIQQNQGLHQQIKLGLTGSTAYEVTMPAEQYLDTYAAREAAMLKTVNGLSQGEQVEVAALVRGMMDKSKDFVQQLADQEKDLKQNHLHYDRLTYSYNEGINYFNRLVDISRQDKLKRIQQTYLFVQITRKTPEPPVLKEEAGDTLFLTGINMEGYANNHVILLLDVSGSMASEGRLPLLKRSLGNLVPYLRPEDELSIVVFSGQAQVALMPTSLSDARIIQAAIDSLKPSGTTNFTEGLFKAFRLARQNYDPTHNNRIILATDGEFDIERTDQSFIRKQVDQYDIHFSVFYYGKTEKLPKKLQKLSQVGKGTLSRINTQNSDESLLGELQAKRVKK